jgi:putative ABC transport system ATP-binding protein
MSTSQSGSDPDPAAPLRAHAVVRIGGLHKTYRDGGETRVLFRGLDLEVQRGERIAIVGRSGTGKSTLLNLISGIDLPDTGSIEIDGQSIQRMCERERTLFRRRHIGFVFQFFNLVPTLTVRENVQLPLELQGLPGHRAWTDAEKWLERVQLAHRADSFPEILSGGEPLWGSFNLSLSCDKKSLHWSCLQLQQSCSYSQGRKMEPPVPPGESTGIAE